MSSESLIVILAVGLIAGWLAGQIVRGTGYEIVNDLVIGVIGAFIGGWLLPRNRHPPWRGHYRRDRQRHDRRAAAPLGSQNSFAAEAAGMGDGAAVGVGPGN